jgi:Arc/MetJ-type ribon-helix-helix transcriptional regulator
MAVTEMSSASEAVRERLRQLLGDRETVVDEYNDNLTRQLIQKVVVLDEDRFEIIYE